MSEALRQEALILTQKVLDYLTEAENEHGVPREKSEAVREQIGYVLRWAYE